MKKDSVADILVYQIMLRGIWLVIGVGISIVFMMYFPWPFPIRSEDADHSSVFYYAMLVAIFISGVLASVFGPMIYSYESMTGRDQLKEIRDKSKPLTAKAEDEFPQDKRPHQTHTRFAKPRR